jgi:hypothetical protein
VRPWFVDLGLLIGGFAAASGLAAILGAINTGTALSFGQLGFAATLLYMLLRR